MKVYVREKGKKQFESSNFSFTFKEEKVLHVGMMIYRNYGKSRMVWEIKEIRYKGELKVYIERH